MGAIDVPNGFTFSLDFDILRDAANVWFESAISLVNGLQIPDYNDG